MVQVVVLCVVVFVVLCVVLCIVLCVHGGVGGWLCDGRGPLWRSSTRNWVYLSHFLLSSPFPCRA